VRGLRLDVEAEDHAALVVLGDVAVGHPHARVLILSRDGVVEPNLVWKDTVLIPTGQTVDILLEVTSLALGCAAVRGSRQRSRAARLEPCVKPGAAT
jgi:hypothetical protein